MAKSIYEILADLTTTTSVPGFGAEIEHKIPAHLFPTPEQFENASDLLAWSEEHGYTHALLQKGLQKGLIDIRATFKSCKKDDTWSVEYGQKNVNETEWSITNRPNQTGAKNIAEAKLEAGIQMAKAMKLASLDDAIILASLTPVYGKEVAEMILAEIAEVKDDNEA